MPLFPLPVIVAIAMWLFILISTGTKLMFSGLVVIFIGGDRLFYKGEAFKKNGLLQFAGNSKPKKKIILFRDKISLLLPHFLIAKFLSAFPQSFQEGD